MSTKAPAFDESLEGGSATQRAIAPAWHTMLMVLLLCAPLIQAALALRANPGKTLQSPPAIELYGIGAIAECIFFLFAWWGVRLRKNSLRTITGAAWANGKEFARGMAWAFAFWAFWYGFLTLVKFGLAAAGVTNGSASGMLYPRGALEMTLWIVNATLAGIVEETVFRGYLLKQFTAWFRSAPAAVIVQAIIFGAVHGYAFGMRQVILIMVSGALIGIFVLWQRNLRSAMVFHAWADIFGVMVRGLPFR
jgi:CAAX protease family protein